MYVLRNSIIRFGQDPIFPLATIIESVRELQRFARGHVSSRNFFPIPADPTESSSILSLKSRFGSRHPTKSGCGSLEYPSSESVLRKQTNGSGWTECSGDLGGEDHHIQERFPDISTWASAEL
jgi:hypothetical protein